MQNEWKQQSSLINIKFDFPKFEPDDNYFFNQNFEEIYKSNSNLSKYKDEKFFPYDAKFSMEKLLFENRLQLSKQDIDYYKKIKLDSIDNLFSKIDSIKLKQFQISLRNTETTPLGNVNLISLLLFMTALDMKIADIVVLIDFTKGIVGLKLYHEGIPKIITLDTYIPYIKSNSNKDDKDESSCSLAFIITKINSYWIILIEKAIAKLYGSYYNLIKLYTTDIVCLLSKAPLVKKIHINKKNYDKLWKLFFEASYKKWIIFAEIGEDSKNTNTNNYPLIRNEFDESVSFFVATAFEMDDKKYVELTTPFIQNNNYHKWTKLKNYFSKNILKTHYVNQDFFKNEKLKSEKSIYCTYDDFYNFFSSTSILKYEEGYNYSFKKLKIISNDFQVVKLNNESKSKTHVYISLNYIIKETEENKNSFLNVNNTNDSKDNNTFTKIYLAKYDTNTNKLEFINGKLSNMNKNIMEVTLDSNLYYLIFKLQIVNFTSPDFVVLSTYSKDQLEFEIIPKKTLNLNIYKNKNKNNSNSDNISSSKSNLNVSSQKNIFLPGYTSTNLFFNMFDNIIVNKGLKQVLDNDNNLIMTSSIGNPKIGLSFVKLENKTKNKILKLYLNYNSNGMKLISHNSNSAVNKDSLFNSEICDTYNNKSTQDIMSEIYLTIGPENCELLVFEESSCDISNKIKSLSPKFLIENVEENIKSDLETLNLTKNYINKDIYHTEIVTTQGSVYIYIYNTSNTKKYNVFIKLSNLNNLELILPKKNNDSILVEPKSNKFIYLNILNEGKFSYDVELEPSEDDTNNKL